VEDLGTWLEIAQWGDQWTRMGRLSGHRKEEK